MAQLTRKSDKEEGVWLYQIVQEKVDSLLAKAPFLLRVLTLA